MEPDSALANPNPVDQLSLLTFNVGLMQLKLMGISWYKNPPFTNRRLKHVPIALRASEADIVCLQEVFDSAHANYIVSSLSFVFPFHARHTSARFMSLDNGLLILSKWPVKEWQFHSFEHITWSESVFGSKGFLRASIDVPGVGMLSIFNLHMVSGTVDPESRSLDDLRLEEMKEVLNVARQTAEKNEIPIIMGDFNAGPSVCPSCYNFLLDSGWQDGFVTAKLKSLLNIQSVCKPMTTADGSVGNKVMGYQEIQAQDDRESFSVEEAERFAAGRSWISEGGWSTPTMKFVKKNLRRSHESLSRFVQRVRLKSAVCVDGDDCLGWTWDPKNPLNVLGPHAGCHGVRCDHLFLPPTEMARSLRSFVCNHSIILFDQPRVLIYSRWLKSCLCAPFYRCFNGGFGHSDERPERAPLLVTLSDHHAVRVTLRRE